MNQRFTITQARAVADKRLSASQHRTLSALGLYGDKDGWCFPKLKTLGDMLGKSRQAVSKDLLVLQELGYVQIKEQYREDGSRTVNLYRLIFDFEEEIDTPPQPVVDTPQPVVDTPQPQELTPLNL